MPLVEVSRYRRAALRRGLTRGMRLLLPADPGPARMLDAARQFDPGAKRILPHRIQVDGRTQFYLSRAFVVDEALRLQARLPPEARVAFFPRWVVDPGAGGAGQEARYRARAAQLLGGLAARFGGTCLPAAPELSGPLHADVYTRRRLAAGELAGLMARHVPTLAPIEVRLLDGSGEADAPAPADLAGGKDGWPLAVLNLLGPGPAAGLSVITVRTAGPAAGADPATARLVGQAALGIAADTGGICADLFGFRVRDPDDLAIRPPLAPSPAAGVVIGSPPAGAGTGCETGPVLPSRTGRQASPADGWRARRKGLARATLIFFCALVFFGLAAANGTAAAWPLLAVNAATGLFFTAAGTLLLQRYRSSR